MEFRSVIRPLVPPLIYEGMHKLKRQIFQSPHVLPLSPPANLNSYQPRESFAIAAAEAGFGYEDHALLSSFVDYRVSLADGITDFSAPLFASFALASSKASAGKIKVLDFGGGSGYFRSYLKTFFEDRFDTDWLVVETKSQVDFVGDLQRDDVRYSTVIEEGHFDLAIFSGSLQCIEDWRAPIKNLNADLIYIARTALGEFDQPFLQTSVHSGVQHRYPGRIIDRKELFDLLSETHRLHCLWKFEAHLLEMGIHDAPAMLWQRHPRYRAKN